MKNMQKAQAASWSPEARRKRAATHAAKRAKGTALVPAAEFPIDAIPERKHYEKRPKVDERVRLAGNLIEVVRLILGGKP